MNMMFPVVVEKDEDGYFAYVPGIQGCYTQGNTYEEVIENIKDVIKLILSDTKQKEELNTKMSLTNLTAISVSL